MKTTLSEHTQKFEDKIVLNNPVCYICGGKLVLDSFWSEIMDNDNTIVQICGHCADKIPKLKRLLLKDINGYLKPIAYITKRPPYKPIKETERKQYKRTKKYRRK